MSVPRNDQRYAELLRLLPINKYNVTKSAIEAGFSPNSAKSQQKRIMQQALKYQLENSGIRLAKGEDVTPASVAQVKKTMAEIVGFSMEDVMENLRQVAKQEKDWSSRLKVVAPLAREYGIHLNVEEDTKVTVPILNVTVKPRLNQATQVDDVAQYTLSVDKGEEGGSGSTSEEGEENTDSPPPHNS